MWACGRARKAGASCWLTSRPVAWSSRRSWRLATGRSASGRGWTRCRRQRGTSAAPSTKKYGAKYEKAVACLTKGQDALLTFYDFPAEHWDHLRTSNPIESVFATVRHRTARTKGALSQDTARLMVFKLVMAAARTWRRLKGENQLPKVIQGVTFRNGVKVTDTPAQSAA